MQTIYIVSSGSFYRPVDTPAGKAGWVAEINFFYAPSFDGKKIPNIQQTFATQAEADEFIGKELHKLFTKTEYRFRDYNARTRPINTQANQTQSESCP